MTRTRSAALASTVPAATVAGKRPALHPKRMSSAGGPEKSIVEASVEQVAIVEQKVIVTPTPVPSTMPSPQRKSRKRARREPATTPATPAPSSPRVSFHSALDSSDVETEEEARATASTAGVEGVAATSDTRHRLRHIDSSVETDVASATDVLLPTMGGYRSAVATLASPLRHLAESGAGTPSRGLGLSESEVEEERRCIDVTSGPEDVEGEAITTRLTHGVPSTSWPLQHLPASSSTSTTAPSIAVTSIGIGRGTTLTPLDRTLLTSQHGTHERSISTPVYVELDEAQALLDAAAAITGAPVPAYAMAVEQASSSGSGSGSAAMASGSTSSLPQTPARTIVDTQHATGFPPTPHYVTLTDHPSPAARVSTELAQQQALRDLARRMAAEARARRQRFHYLDEAAGGNGGGAGEDVLPGPQW